MLNPSDPNPLPSLYPPPTLPPLLPWPLCRYAGILSAVGIHLADVVQEAQEPCAQQLNVPGSPTNCQLEERLDRLQASAEGALMQQVVGARFCVWDIAAAVAVAVGSALVGGMYMRVRLHACVFYDTIEYVCMYVHVCVAQWRRPAAGSSAQHPPWYSNER